MSLTWEALMSAIRCLNRMTHARQVIPSQPDWCLPSKPPNEPSSPQPTFVLINSFSTSSDLFKAQYKDKDLTSVANLLAIEPLGHGKTRTKTETWTYWDM